LLQLLDDEQLHRVKIFTGDAIKIINSLKNRSISKVFILFPDPWPKKRHHKRRIINKKLISNLSIVMKEGAELIIASDHNNYISWIMHHFLNNKNLVWMAKSKKDFLIKPENWPITRFEERAKKLGSICYFFRFYNFNKNN
jgi:tRNA (guanine-N7-)-methyltransferase